jgi:hypothetical protein
LLVNNNCFLGLDGGFLFKSFQPQQNEKQYLATKKLPFFGKNTFGVNFTTCHKTFCQFSLVSIAFEEHFAN